MPLTRDPDKLRAQQQRAQERAVARMKERGAKLAPREGGAKPVPRKAPARGPKHNDAPWRNACIALRGEVCRSCGDTRHVEMDHVIPKSQDTTARADVENGLPLCGAFSGNTPGGCHPAKTAGTLKFEFGWFDPDQIEYLAQKRWVEWDESGQPFGRGMKHFQPKRSAGALKGGHNGD